MRTMRTNTLKNIAGMLALATFACIGSVGTDITARADDASKVTGPVTAFWTLPKEDGKVTIIVPGQKDPVTTSVTNTTVIAGLCLDCNLWLEFKSPEAAKNCAVCGCAVSNAACIVGKPVKGNTWQAMLKQLPHGTGLVPTYNEANKPESGLKKLTVTLRAVMLPVSGLEGQTPDQLLAMVKPLGGTKAELLDNSKLLSITLKSDWNFERATKLEKAIEKANGKVVAPEETK